MAKKKQNNKAYWLNLTSTLLMFCWMTNTTSKVADLKSKITYLEADNLAFTKILTTYNNNIQLLDKNDQILNKKIQNLEAQLSASKNNKKGKK